MASFVKLHTIYFSLILVCSFLNLNECRGGRGGSIGGGRGGFGGFRGSSSSRSSSGSRSSSSLSGSIRTGGSSGSSIITGTSNSKSYKPSSRGPSSSSISSVLSTNNDYRTSYRPSYRNSESNWKSGNNDRDDNKYWDKFGTNFDEYKNRKQDNIFRPLPYRSYTPRFERDWSKERESNLDYRRKFEKPGQLPQFPEINEIHENYRKMVEGMNLRDLAFPSQSSHRNRFQKRHACKGRECFGKESYATVQNLNDPTPPTSPLLSLDALTNQEPIKEMSMNYQDKQTSDIPNAK